MGDNVYLDDRDGVRTPMQWNDGVNGGFSTAPSTRLVLPPIDDPAYGYHVVNVERQERTAGSLLSRIRRLIEVRRQHQAFGRGTIEFLPSGNPRVLAFARRYGGETIVVAANLARSAQQATIELPPSAVGLAAIELMDRVPFPSIGPLPCTLTLEAHGWRWLQVAASPAVELDGKDPRRPSGAQEHG